MDGIEGNDRLEPPTVTMILKSRQATKSVKVSLANKSALAGAIITAIYFIIGLLDAVFPGYLGASGSMGNALTAFHGSLAVSTPVSPLFGSGWYILGGTLYGLPILPVMFAAIKFDLAFSLFVAVVSSLIGLVIGLYAGFFGGIIDRILIKISDFFLQIPLIGLAIIIAYLLGFSFLDLAIAVAISWWPVFAVFVRNKAHSVKKATFVVSATSSGDTATEITFRHIFPSILPDFAARVFIELGLIVQVLATVDFLNLNTSFRYMPEIGNMMSWGSSSALLGTTTWWPLVIPGLFLLGFTLGVYLLGSGLKRSIRYKSWRYEQR
ncbi:binding-protein-dependent transport system inner membrane component [mine drainage metagenome]|uniref:Binding-protein-dependent transport system inner membrane component n=2 Tax=mine drainage metagenome TaxID=410659 RepID=T1ASD8_9ZZZZ